jgi:hypothetical protein
MNERIRELAEESRDLVPTQTKVGGGMYIPGPIVRGDVNLQRFAELIVKECKDVLLNMINNQQGDFDSLDQALTEINEHFGVEE